MKKKTLDRYGVDDRFPIHPNTTAEIGSSGPRSKAEVQRR